MYILAEYRPYEGEVVREFTTLEEVLKYLPKDETTRKHRWCDWTLYEVVEELNIEFLMRQHNV